ncbi:cysteine-rich receptor-like protein kinase, partial [Trifolium medium]|nr:cysteine-rich receptor-like protein kinase [Trifolium medium]
VLVNGSPTDEFPMERGLRQGDPLSPFLFLLAAEGLNIMMRAAFADDTLLLGVKSWANVRTLRGVLVLFEAVSGLKVNFHKSMLVGVYVAELWLLEAAAVLGCSVGRVPFMYLGLPIGGDPRRLSLWEPVVNRIRTRLMCWKSRFLSFGGRLVLLKFVLIYLPVYALSFFRAPSGGLGVRQLRDFNTALLGKWCWKMLTDKIGLWYRLLGARYGEEAGRVSVGGGVALRGGGRFH